MFPAPARGNRRALLPAPGRSIRWYVRPAVEASGKLLACAVTLLVAGCGGAERQDEDEPEGNFAVEVVEASFPEEQKLAKRSSLLIKVRNAGDRTVPNLAVTVDGFSIRSTNDDLADPERPQFVINGRPREIGGFPESKDASPLGCDTAYVNTWACGPLKAGRERTFRWSVTAVKAGDFEITCEVAAGLDGKAKAVDVSGNRPTGVFTGTVSGTPPDSRVADDGKTVVEGTR